MLSTEPAVHRLSYEDVGRMYEAGILGPEDRVELIDGVLVDLILPSPEHSAIVSWLIRHFVGASGEREVRVQDPLLIERGFLMPDLMVVDPPARDQHPATALLIVEASGSTLRHDRWKAGRYAAAAVDEYWIVDPTSRVISVHRGPSAIGYDQVALYRDGDEVETPVGAPPVDVSELLG